MTAQPLGEFLETVALRRVQRGGVAVFEGLWLYRGRPMPEGVLRELYGLLVDEGLLEVSPADEYAVCRVRVTEAGLARYVTLHRRRKAWLVPPPEHPATETPADHRLSDPCTAPGDRPVP